ncbi:MAG: hypothetical protein ABIR47_07425 [Candidatus Kapaibacterium sp.]
MGQRKGGSNLFEFFIIAGNVFTTKEHSLNQIYKGDMKRRNDGGFDITIDQDEDTASLETFLETYRVLASTTGAASKYEDGSTPSAGSSDVHIGWIGYHGKSTDVKVTYGVAEVDPTSGSFSTEDSKESRPTIILHSVAAPAATTVTKTLFSSSKVTQPGADKIIAISSLGKVDFLALPTA